MVRFWLGFVTITALGALAAYAASPAWYRPDLWLIGAAFFAIPAGLGWFAADSVQRFRPRRWLDPRVRRGRAVLALGVLAGLAWVSLAALVISLIPWPIGQLLAAWTLAVLVPGAMLLASPRSQGAQCIHCGYDLTDSGGRCPECGVPGSRSALYTSAARLVRPSGSGDQKASA